MKLSYYVYSFLLVICLLISGCTDAPSDVVSGDEVTIGALVPLTGDWANQGSEVQAALELAVQDINDRQAAIGSNHRINLLIEDSGTDPAIALEKLQGLAAKGVKIVIGPASSAEVSAVKEYANQNGILIIGYASTASSLAVVDDNIVRLVPDDTRQGEAMAVLLEDDGIKAIVPMVRNDVWGKNLLEATETEFRRMGGTVIDGVYYNQDTDDFTMDLLNVTDRVGTAMDQYSANEVGVYLVGLDEVNSIISLASAQDSIISTVKWYGSDGTARNGDLVTDAQAAVFAAETSFVCPIYGENEETDEYNRVASQIEMKTGAQPDAYAIAAYDALQVAARASFEAGNEDAATLKEAVFTTTDSYYGATGWTKLNKAGDRLYADYDFLTIHEKNGAYEWDTAFRYQIDPGVGGHLVMG